MELEDWDLLQITKWDFDGMTEWDWNHQKNRFQWRLRDLNKSSRPLLKHRKPRRFEKSNTTRTFLHFLWYHALADPKLHWLKNKFFSLSPPIINSRQYLLWLLDWYVLLIHWHRYKFLLQLQFQMTSKYSILVLFHLAFPPTAKIDKLNRFPQSKVRKFLKVYFLAVCWRLGLT